MLATQTRTASFSILELNLPGRTPVPAGVLLHDPLRDQLYLRMRRDWDQIAPDDVCVLVALEADMRDKATELGGDKLLAYFEGTLSNTLRISDRTEVVVEDYPRALDRLYRQHVRTNVIEFVTHVPRYSLAAAAGKFLDNAEVTPEGWEEAPPDLKLTEKMFAAHIAGRSMEPRIPDGSVCVFRSGLAGSNQGKLVLVELLGRGSNDRYTVKRYRSEKIAGSEGSWQHSRIWLEPLNPEFEVLDLDPQDAENVRVIAEFVAVIG